MEEKSYTLNNYGKVESTNVRWLWYPYIPYGKLTLVQGDPGEGKTTMMLHIAADLTKGRMIPGGEANMDPQSVIFQSTEDSICDTVKPRLEDADADCSKVFYLQTSEDEALSLGDDRFEDAINRTNAKLLIIDPLQSFLGTDLDMSKIGSMRKPLMRLAKLAERTGCAVVIIGHMNKGSGSKGIYRGLGSIDIAAVSRSILLVGRDKANPEIRAVVPIKTSLAPEGRSYAFALRREEGFQWIGESNYSEDELLGNISLGSKQERARDLLRSLLRDGDQKSSDVFEHLNALGISRRTVQTAKKSMNIRAYKRENVWYWSITDKS